MPLLLRNPERAFLTAEWRYLAMLNYEIDPAILLPLVPLGTELDTYRGRHFVSVIGFLFLNTRVLGLAPPLHRNFEEVNLRFYVRRVEGSTVKRGVVFVREIVPRRAIALLANLAYNEPYTTLPMSHRLEYLEGAAHPSAVEYSWNSLGFANSITVNIVGDPAPMVDGSAEQFIADHYYGYTPQRDGGTVEYQVQHPSWRIWPVSEPGLKVDAERLYGRQFAEVLRRPPATAFLAEGSPVTVYRPRRLA